MDSEEAAASPRRVRRTEDGRLTEAGFVQLVKFINGKNVSITTALRDIGIWGNGVNTSKVKAQLVQRGIYRTADGVWKVIEAK